jgi:hypothetical protein
MNRLWRTAGALCIAHVVLLLAGYSQQRSPAFGAGPSSTAATYAGVATTKMYAGGFLAMVAWLVLLAAATLVARLVRGSGETTAWFGNLIVAGATLATAVTLGSFAATGAAFYGAKHGYPADTVAVVNGVSKFADFIAIAALGVTALAVGGAGLAGATLPRWTGWVSIAVGIVGVASASGTALLNTGTLIVMAWLVMVGVVLLRGPARVRRPVRDNRVVAQV